MSQRRSLAYVIKNLCAVRLTFVLAFLLALGTASVATPVSAQPFAYVANQGTLTVSMIDADQELPGKPQTVL